MPVAGVQEVQHLLAVVHVARRPRPARRGRAGAAGPRPGSRRWSPPGRWSSSRCGRTAAPPRRRRASPSPPCCSVRATIFSSSSCRWARVSASSAPNGSSISSTLGSIASARAMPTRCFMPPEISCGRLCRGVGHARPVPAPPGCARFSCGLDSLRAEHALHRQVTLSKQVSQGSSEWFWNTTARSGPGRGDLAVVAQQHAAGGREQAGDQVQQRRLAAARVADQRDELALGDVEVDVAQRVEAALLGVEHHLGVLRPG